MLPGLGSLYQPVPTAEPKRSSSRLVQACAGTKFDQHHVARSHGRSAQCSVWRPMVALSLCPAIKACRADTVLLCTAPAASWCCWRCRCRCCCTMRATDTAVLFHHVKLLRSLYTLSTCVNFFLRGSRRMIQSCARKRRSLSGRVQASALHTTNILRGAQACVRACRLQA